MAFFPLVDNRQVDTRYHVVSELRVAPLEQLNIIRRIQPRFC